MKKIKMIAVATITILLASCSNTENSAGTGTDTMGLSTDSLTPYDSSTTVNNAQDTASNTTMAFALKAGAGGLLEIELGNLAKINAAHPRVKDFGKMMVQDHTAANLELTALAQQKNFNIPSTLSIEAQTHVNELKALKGADFDRKYMDMMVKDHKEDIDLFEKAARHSTDADVKAFAAKTLPTLKMHLDSAKTIEGALK
jgi:putative membrane protein